MKGEKVATIFMDFDGTLSEMPLLWLEYSREVGALLAQQFGGEEDAWAKAAIDALEAVNADYREALANNTTANYSQWLDAARLKSAHLIFGAMGVFLPENPLELVMETQFQALTACNALFDGAAECLQTLTQNGVTVHIASANDSEFLRGALIGAGIEQFIEARFGPDQIDCAKEGPEFYRRIFAKTGVAASDTLVVDDHPETLQWAMQAGAKAVQVRLSREMHYSDTPGVAAILTDLRDLPPLVRQILG